MWGAFKAVATALWPPLLPPRRRRRRPLASPPPRRDTALLLLLLLRFPALPSESSLAPAPQLPVPTPRQHAPRAALNCPSRRCELALATDVLRCPSPGLRRVLVGLSDAYAVLTGPRHRRAGGDPKQKACDRARRVLKHVLPLLAHALAEQGGAAVGLAAAAEARAKELAPRFQLQLLPRGLVAQRQAQQAGLARARRSGMAGVGRGQRRPRCPRARSRGRVAGRVVAAAAAEHSAGRRQPRRAVPVRGRGRAAVGLVQRPGGRACPYTTLCALLARGLSTRSGPGLRQAPVRLAVPVVGGAVPAQARRAGSRHAVALAPTCNRADRAERASFRAGSSGLGRGRRPRGGPRRARQPPSPPPRGARLERAVCAGWQGRGGGCSCSVPLQAHQLPGAELPRRLLRLAQRHSHRSGAGALGRGLRRRVGQVRRQGREGRGRCRRVCEANRAPGRCTGRGYQARGRVGAARLGSGQVRVVSAERVQAQRREPLIAAAAADRRI